MIQLLVTDKSLNIVGDPLTGWTEMSCELHFNEPASGSVTLPAEPEFMAQLTEGRRLVVIRDGDIWCAGPIEVPQNYTRASDGEQEPGQVRVDFTDDLGRIAGYHTYPDPTLAFADQVTATEATYGLTSTNAETIIRTLVNVNCGPGAISTRRIEQLALDTVAGVGSTTSITTRFEALLDVCRTVAAGDSLGFRTRQVGNEIHFGVYQPQDLTGTARFSWDLGNLRGNEYTLSGPAATSELVIGGEEGDRVFVEVASGAQAAWWRVEKVLDQSGSSEVGGELTQAGTAELVNDNPGAMVAPLCVDTDDLKAGRDFFLGDKVSVVPAPGVEIADVVRTIRLEATPDGGEIVTSVVGNQDATTETQLINQIRILARRLGRVETRR